MSVQRVLITDPDRVRVASLLDAERRWPTEHSQHLRPFHRRLATATVVPEHRIPADVVTLHSRVRIRNLGTGHETTCLVTEPWYALASAGTVSVVSPLGAALLGRRTGEEIEICGQSGPRRLRIEQVLFQPEAVRHQAEMGRPAEEDGGGGVPGRVATCPGPRKGPLAHEEAVSRPPAGGGKDRAPGAPASATQD